jgi:hypothetical protein
MALGAQNSGSLFWVGMEVHWWKKIKAEIIPSTSDFSYFGLFLRKKLRNEPTKKLIFRFWPIGTIDEGVMSVYVARLDLHSVKQPEH